MSDGELNGCMEAAAAATAPCEIWGEAVGPLAPKCRAFSCSSRGERDVGEVGNEDLKRNAQGEQNDGAQMMGG